jgi:hypothetical protein
MKGETILGGLKMKEKRQQVEREMGMSHSKKVSGKIDAQLQIHLDALNAAFTAFKQAEAETPAAEEQEDSNRLIFLWNIKNQAVQSYMREWDFLIQYGQIFFEEETKRLHLAPLPKENQQPDTPC